MVLEFTCRCNCCILTGFELFFSKMVQANVKRIQITVSGLWEILDSTKYSQFFVDLSLTFSPCSTPSSKSPVVKTCSPACQTCDILREEFYEEEEEEDEDEEGKPQSADKGMIVPSQFGVAQNLGEVFPEKVRTLMDETYSYMMERVFVEENFANIRGACQNRMADCSIWAASGECERNTGWMSFNCAPACQTCERLDFDLRCPVDPNLPELLENPGDLNRMFERITTDPFWEKFGPIDVISSPAKGGPWIVTFDNFVSDEECNALIEYGYAEGYKRSEDVGDVTIDGTYDSTVSDHRTSKNAWLLDDGEEDPITGPVVERIMTLAGAPYNNSEWLQLLKYEPGEYYLEHHDYIVHEAEEERPQGPRILTVFLYLNDVEAGGGTHFGPLGITVMPKKGRALVWPSVLDEDPWEMDERTHHEALKVEAGVKYGANAWIHLRDFKKPYEQNCV